MALDPAAKVWLEQFPAKRRSTLANWFHFAVRNGAVEPAAILNEVRGQARHKHDSRWSNPDDQAFALQVATALKEDRERALAYVAFVLAYEAAPAAERAALKEQQAEAGRKAWMEQQPPTDAQRRFLVSLGCPTVPENRRQASELIEEWKGRA